MKRNLKKTLAFILVIALTMTMFSTLAFAGGSADKVRSDMDQKELISKLVDGKVVFMTGNFTGGKKVKITYGDKSFEMKSNEEKAVNPQYKKNEKPVTTYTIEAIAKDDYEFVKWVDIDVESSEKKVNPQTRDLRFINMITPTFEDETPDTYNLTVYASPAHGGEVEVKPQGEPSIFVSNGQTIAVEQNSKVTLTAIPNSSSDYRFISYGGDITDSSKETTFKVTEDMEVVANFSTKVEPILEFIVDNGDGTYDAHFGYDVDGNEEVVHGVGNKNKLYGGGIPSQNADQPIKFLPGRHYDVFTVEFDGDDLYWTLDGKTIKAEVNDSELRFTLRPELFQFGKITVENTNNGKVTEFDGEEFTGGTREIYIPCYTNGQPTKLELKATPESGVQFIEWDDIDSNKNPRYYTFSTSWLGTKKMVKEPDAMFSTGHVVLSIVCEDYGSSSISKKVYDAGNTVDISAIAKYITPIAGYAFVGFEEASSDFAITKDSTLTAKFVKTTDAVVTIKTDGHGYTSQNYVVYSLNDYVDISDLEALLTPASGYKFNKFVEYDSDFYITGHVTLTADFTAVYSDVPKTGDDSADLSIAWILAMVLPLLAGAGYLVAKRQK